MAYIAYTNRQRDEKKDESNFENPYSGLAKASFTPEAVTKSEASAEAPATAGNQLAGGSSGPSATGFVNFDRIFNANGDVAKRESGRLAQGAQNKAQAAQQGLTGAQQNFQNQLTGATARSPSMGDFQRASAGGKAADEGVSVAPVSPAPGQVIYNQPGNDEQQWEAAMRKGAAQKPYSGPGSLSETSDYDKLVRDTVAADDEVNALQSNAGIAGMVGNPLDAALYGASGRPAFAELGRSYGGLKDKLNAANVASQEQANQARKESQGAIDQYGILTQTLDDARKAQAAGSPTAPDTGSGWHPKGFGSYKDFVDKVGPMAGVHDAVTGLDPVNQLLEELGSQGIYEGGTVAEGFRKNFGGLADSTIGTNIDDQNRLNAFQDLEKEYGADVSQWLWDHMTEELWNSLAGKNAGAMKHALAEFLAAGGFQSQTKGTPTDANNDGYSETAPAPAPASSPVVLPEGANPDDYDENGNYIGGGGA